MYSQRQLNTVGVTIGIIFVNSASKGLKYEPTHTTIDDEIAYTQILLRLLKCTEVRVIQDATKKEIIEQFQVLETESAAYEEYH